MSKTTTTEKAPMLRMNPREHFWVKGLKKAFDLSGLVPLYLHVSSNLDTITKNVDMEWNIGRSTIIYSVDDEKTIHLISGWAGNRQKLLNKK
jgi:hypothetical protein